MVNYFWVSIKGKNTKNFLNTLFRQKINMMEIKYKKNEVLIKVSYDDYKKILKSKTTCVISIVKTAGTKRIEQLYQKYKMSLLIFVISVFFIVFLSNFILFINIESSNNELKNVIKNELIKNNITLYTSKKSYKKLKEITENIKNDNLDQIEWIEFEQKGVVLNVKVIQRVDKKIKEYNKYQDIVASKNGYIRKIESRNGQLLKNIDDYVKKGDVIISGNIFRNDKVVGKVHASGKVYAEVWYIVKARQDLSYIDVSEKRLGKVGLSLFIYNKEIKLLYFPKKVINAKTITLFHNNYFSIKLKKEKTYFFKNQIYSSNKLQKILEQKAKKDISKTLEKDEYIITEKTLKKYVKNGKMYIEVFFKCYEDIAEEKDIQKIGEKKDE